MKKSIAAAFALLCLSACGSELNVMSDSIDAGRFSLKAGCHAETVKCEIARAALNDFVAAYDLALAAKGTPSEAAFDKAAMDAMKAFLDTVKALHAPVTSGGDDADGGTV